LELTVDGKLPGDVLEVEPGSAVRIKARAFGERNQIPLKNLQILAHGKVLKSVTAAGEDEAESLSLQLDFEVQRGTWLAARCEAAKTQVAHTTPIYLTVDGRFHNPETAPELIRRSMGYLDEIEEAMDNPGQSIDTQITRHETRLRERVEEVRRRLADLNRELR
jgi:hypothetical protein